MTFGMPAANYLFLLSLAFTSWALLCFFSFVKDILSQQTVDIKIEQPTPTPAGTLCGTEYGMFVNVMCTFVCVYFLAKLTSITEGYIAKHIFPHILRYGHCNGTWTQIDAHIVRLRRRNENLRLELKKLRNIYRNYLPDELESSPSAVELEKTGADPRTQLNIPRDELKEVIPGSVLKKFWDSNDTFRSGSFPKILTLEELERLSGFYYS